MLWTNLLNFLIFTPRGHFSDICYCSSADIQQLGDIKQLLFVGKSLEVYSAAVTQVLLKFQHEKLLGLPHNLQNKATGGQNVFSEAVSIKRDYGRD